MISQTFSRLNLKVIICTGVVTKISQIGIIYGCSGISMFPIAQSVQFTQFLLIEDG